MRKNGPKLQDLKVARFQGNSFAGVKLALLEYLPESCSAGLPTAQNLEGTSTNCPILI